MTPGDERGAGEVPDWPFGALVERARNATSPLERHNAAYYLAECALKVAAALRVVLWMEHRLEPESPLARDLEGLLRPSTGHWVDLLRRLDRDLHRSELQGVVGREFVGRLEEPRKDARAAASWAAAAFRFRVVSAEVRQRAGKGSINGFADLLVAYRNEVLGHGAQRDAAFYGALGPLLLDAAVETLQDARLG
jgi:hypothetical protein